MKSLTSTLLGLLIAIAGFAQKQDSYQTIFGNNDMHWSGMGGFESHYASLGGHFAYGGGGGGGVIINKKLILGGYGLGFTLDHDYTVNTITYEHLDVNHGGFLFGYTFQGNRPIHVTTFLQLGWGEITANQSNTSLHDNIMALNPSVELEFNITRFFRIAAGAHYQVITGVDRYNDLSNSDFSGPGGKLAFRFGWF